MEIDTLRQYQVEYDEFKEHFELVQTCSTIAFGDYMIMKNVQTGQEFLIKPQETYSLEETEELLVTINEINIKLNECQHFLQFLGFTEVPYDDRITEEQEKENPESCSNMIYLIFERIEKKLEEGWVELINQQGSKIEQLLMQLAQTLCECFLKLEEIGQTHTDVSLQNILIGNNQQNGSLEFKLIYSQYTTSAFRQVIDHQQNPTNYFLAPELSERLQGGKQSSILSQSSQGLDPQKIDVFAFGQLLMFLAAFKDSSITMEMKQQLGYDDTFTEYVLNILKQEYSNEFVQLVTAMANYDMAKRPSFSEIKNTLQRSTFVKQIIKENQQKSPLIPKIPLTVPTSDTTNQNTYNSQQTNQATQLEKVSLQKRAQEIRLELQQNQLQMTKHERSVSSEINNLSNQNLLQYLTPQRVDYLKKSNVSQTQNGLQKSNYFPVNHSPYQQRTSNSNSGIYFPYQSSKSFQNGSLYFKCDIYQSQSRMSPSRHTASICNQEIYNKEFFAKMLRELEKNTILNAQNNLLSTIIKKEYQDGSVYLGEIGKNGQGQEVREGKGIYYYKTSDKSNQLESELVPLNLFGEVYAGDWKANLFDGNGVYLFSSGERYQGSLKEGQKCGQGIYYYSNSNQYDGEWAEDLKNGYGHFYYNQIKEKYEGNFLNGQRHKHGIYTFQNGDMQKSIREGFEGQWEQGEKNGAGKVQFTDGTQFEGEWKNNQPNGHGKMVYPNGDVYEGNFAAGMKEGDGIYIHSNANSTYKGKFSTDEPMGFGQFHYANNDVYEGQIKNGQRHGKGTYIYVNGDKFEGEWKFDKKSGVGVFSFSDGSFYEGLWSLGKIKGYGVMNYGNGDTYKGEWLKDKKHGKGFYKWGNGNSYKGDWRADKMTGKGQFISQNGQTFSGVWLENKLIKKI